MSSRDLGALERKVRAAGRPWTMGDIAMIADGQWAVRTKTADVRQEAVIEDRLADGQRMELTLAELARVVGAGDPDAHHQEEN